MSMGWRPYQLEAAQGIRQAWREGVPRQLGVLPTGTGKSKLFAGLPDFLKMQKGQGYLVLVDRSDLVIQGATHIEKANPGRSVAIEQAGDVADPNFDIVVASVQSLGQGSRYEEGKWTWGKRLLKFSRDQFKLVMIDESHQAVNSKNHAAILSYFRCYKPDPDNCRADRLLVGVTATPNRGDSIGLEKLFDKIVFSKTIGEMVEAGWLVHPHGHVIHTRTDISGLHVKAGDFDQGELSSAVNNPTRNKLIVDKYEELAGGTQGICFTVDIQHATDIVEMFNSRGILAHVVQGKTSRNDRKKLYQMFIDRHIKILASAGTLNIGLDLPLATTAIFAGPTKSSVKYIQSLGRVLRPSPAPEELAAMRAAGIEPKNIKSHAIILDFVDVSGRHSLQTTPTLFGLRADFDLEGESVVSTARQVEQMQATQPGLDLKACKDIKECQHMVTQVDLLRPPVVPEEARQYSRYSWMKVADGTLQLRLTDGGMIQIKTNNLGQHEVFSGKDGHASVRFVSDYIGQAFKLADSLIPKSEQVLLNTTAKWQSEPPTEKQCKALFQKDVALKARWRSGVQFYAFAAAQHKAGHTNYSKGGISRMIDSHNMAVRA